MKETRKEWIVKNVSNKTIKITDIPKIPSIKPNKQLDLLQYASLTSLNDSRVLDNYIKNGKLSSEDVEHTHDDKADVEHTHPLNDIDNLEFNLEDINKILNGISKEVNADKINKLIDGSNVDDLHSHDFANFDVEDPLYISNNILKLNYDDSIFKIEDGKLKIIKSFIEHKDLSNINSSDYYHLKKTEYNVLTKQKNADDLHNHEISAIKDIDVKASYLNKAGDFFKNTDITASQANQLIDGSNVDSLHSHNYLKDISSFNTDDLLEGSSNLYFTNERVDDRVNNLLVEGSNITLSYDDDANQLTISANGGSSVSPGGDDGDIQYNNSDSFGGSTKLSWDDDSDTLSVDTLSLSSGSITDSSGQIDFGSTDLTTDSGIYAGSETVGGENYGIEYVETKSAVETGHTYAIYGKLTHDYNDSSSLSSKVGIGGSYTDKRILQGTGLGSQVKDFLYGIYGSVLHHSDAKVEGNVDDYNICGLDFGAIDRAEFQDTSASSMPSDPNIFLTGARVRPEMQSTFNADGDGYFYIESKGFEVKGIHDPTLTSYDEIKHVSYGLYISDDHTSEDAGVDSTAYGIYLADAQGADTNYFLYNSTTVNSLIGGDGAKLLFGSDGEASIQYNDGNLIINPQENDSGNLVISNGDIGGGTSSPNFKLDVDGTISSGSSDTEGEVRVWQSNGYPDKSYYMSLKRDGSTDKNGLYIGNISDFILYYNTSNGNTYVNAANDMRFVIDGSTKMAIQGDNVGIGTISPDERLEVDGNIYISNNNDKLYLGDAKDASIYYDGDDLIINPAEGGSGSVKIIEGDFNASFGLFEVSTSETSTGVDVLNLKATSSGGVSCNFGSELKFLTEDEDGTEHTSGIIKGGVGTSIAYGQMSFSSIISDIERQWLKVDRLAISFNTSIKRDLTVDTDLGSDTFLIENSTGDVKIKSTLIFVGDGDQEASIYYNDGDLVLDPASNNILLNDISYLNFGTTSGDSGYGLRDDSGTMQYKNDGGTWQDIGSGGGTSINFGTEHQIPYTNSTTDDFNYSSALNFDGTNLNIEANNSKLTFGGSKDASIYYDGDDLNIDLDNPSNPGIIKLNDDVNVSGDIVGGGVTGTVIHEDDANIERPDYDVVIWIGSVEPFNSIDNDIWIDNSSDTS
ncbi:MAG: hypothetical protein ACOCRO_01085 [Halanaerobiales bacterium]